MDEYSLKITPELRRLIYAVYDGVCQYSGKKIPYSEANVDHIVPRSVTRQKVLNSLTDSNTTIVDRILSIPVDSILNYTLAHREINLEKSDKILSVENLETLLLQAKNKAPLILQKLATPQGKRTGKSIYSNLAYQENILLDHQNYVMYHNSDFMHQNIVNFSSTLVKRSKAAIKQSVVEIVDAFFGFMQSHDSKLEDCLGYGGGYSGNECAFRMFTFQKLCAPSDIHSKYAGQWEYEPTSNTYSNGKMVVDGFVFSTKVQQVKCYIERR